MSKVTWLVSDRPWREHKCLVPDAKSGCLHVPATVQALLALSVGDRQVLPLSALCGCVPRVVRSPAGSEGGCGQQGDRVPVKVTRTIRMGGHGAISGHISGVTLPHSEALVPHL